MATSVLNKLLVTVALLRMDSLTMLLLAQERGVWKNSVMYLLTLVLRSRQRFSTVAQFPVLVMSPFRCIGVKTPLMTLQVLGLDMWMAVTLFLFGGAVSV